MDATGLQTRRLAGLPHSVCSTDLRRFLGDLGANPVETITNTTGIWTLRFIVITLAITPLRWLTKWNPLINFRRMFGLFAFFYGGLHFTTYFVLDHPLISPGCGKTCVKRPYITVGFTGVRADDSAGADVDQGMDSPAGRTAGTCFTGWCTSRRSAR